MRVISRPSKWAAATVPPPSSAVTAEAGTAAPKGREGPGATGHEGGEGLLEALPARPLSPLVLTPPTPSQGPWKGRIPGGPWAHSIVHRASLGRALRGS